jgi:nucleotide-binding universal stress UspA family protein
LSEVGGVGPRTIIVGAENSPTSLRALDYAAAKHAGGAPVSSPSTSTCRAASPPPSTPSASPPSPGQSRRRASPELALEAELRAEVERLATDIDIDIGFRGVTCDALCELTPVAKNQHADAIVVGASTRSHSRLAGSIAPRLARQRRWPV